MLLDTAFFVQNQKSGATDLSIYAPTNYLYIGKESEKI